MSTKPERKQRTVVRDLQERRDGRLKGRCRYGRSSVHCCVQTDKFAVEDRVHQMIQSDGQVRQVFLIFAWPKRDSAFGAAGDANAVRRDVQKCSDAIPLFLNSPSGTVPFNFYDFGWTEIRPVVEQHRRDWLFDRYARVILFPDVLTECGNERGFAFRNRGNFDVSCQAGGLEFGKRQEVYVECQLPQQILSLTQPSSALRRRAGFDSSTSVTSAS